MFSVRFAQFTAATATALACGALVAGAASPAAAVGGTSVAIAPKKTWQVTGGQIFAMVRVGDKIVIGGNFTAMRSPSGESWQRNRIAMISAATGAPVRGWNPGANNTIRALATDGARVFAGGSFSWIGGKPRSRMAALSAATGAVQNGFTANGNGEVRAITLTNNKLYIGGLFTTVNGVGRLRAAALSPTSGSVDGTWKPSASWAVNSITRVPGTGKLVLGGEFSLVSGQARRYLAMVNLSGSVLPWAPVAACVNVKNPCVVRSVAAAGGLVYAAISGLGGRISAYYASTGARKWTQYGDGDTQAVVVAGNTVYVGGHFDPLFGSAGQRHQLAAMDASTGAMKAWAPGLHGGTGIWAIIADAHGLHVGGLFEVTRGGKTVAKNIAHFPRM